jgi:hypothetical protein
MNDAAVAHQLESTDGVLTLGYQLGYVTAMCERRQGFTLRALSSQLAALCRILARAGAHVALSSPQEGRYTVSWTQIEVSFP